MLRKRKDKELEKLGLDEGEVIDFSEFEDFDEDAVKNKGLKPEDIERNFIFHVEHGCPICGADVKGNDHYRYFCERCNVLFDKKDILEKEFGKSVADAERGAVRKTKLTDEERKELDRKRKELKDRIFNEFSEKQKKELVVKAEERAEEEAVESEEKEEEVLETVEPEEMDEVIEELPEETGDEEPVQDEPEPEEEVKEEYELEDPDKIIASNQSNKMHKGDCHFVRKIHPKNRIYVNSIEDGEEQGYQMCVCLRRLKAMQR
ncbi:MAG: hypothetical protein KKD17_05365 [Nanoarchaeota archaeon]|nr:hypothetical protein [Nanoarchaeota archaeon]